jgi:AraC-like DNA-binding protein
VINVREVIEAHVADAEFNVEQLCSERFMSRSKLHRKPGALTGCSPNKFVCIVRLNKAKVLLKDNELNIASITMDCGLNDPG